MADTSNAAPVRDLEFAGEMAALCPETPIAVAVSGGADSMALLLLTSTWMKAGAQQSGLCALTVDHGLRDGSAAEAQQVADWCQSIGVTHRILHWHGAKPSSDIQAQARRARYSLMSDYCRQHGVRSLLLGHQYEDQAETFLLRLGRGSGVDGLAAMAPSLEWNGVRFLRPLLAYSRQRLQATLLALGQPWIEDPSNQNPRFARVRARGVLTVLEDAGISAARIVGTAHRMRRVRAALEQATAQLMKEAVQWDQAGFAELRLAALFIAPEEIGLRALARILTIVGGQEYPPRLLRLERLFAWLRQNPFTGGRTLSGCRIIPRKDRILIVREPAAIGPEITLSAGEAAVWDNRFFVRLIQYASVRESKVFTVQPVGVYGLSQMRGARPGNLPPRIVSQSVPGLWRGGKLLAAPLLGFTDPASVAAAAFEVRFSPRHALLPDNLCSK
ncbi:MAG: tRNA lysidine(34) synthetase TilS [Alphaproteobacteria bacterium]